MTVAWCASRFEQRRGQLLVAGEDGDPFGEGQIRRDHGRPALVAIGDQIEEQLAADAVEGHEAELVDDQDVEREQTPLEATQLARVAGLEQLAHEIGCPREEHAALLLRRLDAERDRQMRLAGAGRGSARSGAPPRAGRAAWRDAPTPPANGGPKSRSSSGSTCRTACGLRASSGEK